MMRRKLTRLPPEPNRPFCDARFLLVWLKIRSLEGQLTDNLAANDRGLAWTTPRPFVCSGCLVGLKVGLSRRK